MISIINFINSIINYTINNLTTINLFINSIINYTIINFITVNSLINSLINFILTNYLIINSASSKAPDWNWFPIFIAVPLLLVAILCTGTITIKLIDNQIRPLLYPEPEVMEKTKAAQIMEHSKDVAEDNTRLRGEVEMLRSTISKLQEENVRLNMMFDWLIYPLIFICVALFMLVLILATKNFNYWLKSRKIEKKPL